MFFEESLYGPEAAALRTDQEVVEALPRALIVPDPKASQPADEKAPSMGIPVHFGSTGCRARDVALLIQQLPANSAS